MNRFTFLSLPVFIVLIAVVSQLSPTAMAVDSKYMTVIPWKAGEPAKYSTRSKSVSGSTFYDDVNRSEYDPIENPKYRLFGNADKEKEFLDQEWAKTGGRPAIAQCESGSGLETFKTAYLKALSGRGNPLYPDDFDLSTSQGKDDKEKYPAPVSRSAAAVCKTENLCCNRGALAGNLRLQEIILKNEFVPPYDLKNKDSESGICMSEFAYAVTEIDSFCEQADSLDFGGTKFKDFAMKDGEVDVEKISSLIVKDPNRMTANQENVSKKLCGYGTPTVYPTRYAGCYMAGYLWALNQKNTSHPSCAEFITQRFINGEPSSKPTESSGINEAAAADSNSGKTSVVGAPADGKGSKAENLTKKP